MESIKRVAAEAMDALPRKLQDLLGETINFADIPYDTITDDPTDHRSLFDREDNKKIFQPYIDAVFAALRSPGDATKVSGSSSLVTETGAWQTCKVRRFLVTSEGFQDALLIVFCLICGVPPRAWQAALLAFAPYDELQRNVRLMNGQLVVSNPQAKQMEQLQASAFWGFTTRFRNIFLCYIGVIRPIQLLLLTEVDQLKIPTDEHRVHIFVHLTPKRGIGSFVYDGKDVNAVLAATEHGMGLGPLWHVFITIFRRLCPRLLVDPNRSCPLDEQSQHIKTIARGHYALDEIMRSLGQVISEAERQLSVSHTLQVFIGLAPSSCNPEVTSLVGDDRAIYRAFAVSAARLLLMQGAYSINVDGHQKAEKRQAARKAYEAMPFLFAPNVSGFIAKDL